MKNRQLKKIFLMVFDLCNSDYLQIWKYWGLLWLNQLSLYITTLLHHYYYSKPGAFHWGLQRKWPEQLIEPISLKGWSQTCDFEQKREAAALGSHSTSLESIFIVNPRVPKAGEHRDPWGLFGERASPAYVNFLKFTSLPQVLNLPLFTTSKFFIFLFCSSPDMGKKPQKTPHNIESRCL